MFDDIRRLDYYLYGNVFTGSGPDFRYQIRKDGETLLASVWREDVCHALAQEKTEQAFEPTEDGFEQLRAWLRGQARLQKELTL